MINKHKNKKYLFCGVGGSGMSALAVAMVARGAMVYGSDRNYDRGLFPDHYNKLVANGIMMVPQDGKGVTRDLDALVVSSAIEPSIPDVKAAQDLHINIIKRAELLADIANAAQSITIAGTNGKSTVTGMVGKMLSDLSLDPTILNGGGMLDFDRQNAVIGQSETMVLETDESDGSVTNFRPKIAVLTNVSDDHKDIDELIKIFAQYLDKSDHQVLNMDCPNVRLLAEKYPKANLYQMSKVPDDLDLSVPGKHNVSNALAALAVSNILGLNKNDSIASLNTFKGIASRLEIIGRTDSNVTVIDDFAHNPDKITASLKTLKDEKRRLHLIYQPQGFGPLKHQKVDLINIFSKFLSDRDVLYMLEAFYAGGTADKSVSSVEIVDNLHENAFESIFFDEKKDVLASVLSKVEANDIICVMGARDDGLRELARQIFKELK